MRVGFNPNGCNLKTNVPHVLADQTFGAHLTWTTTQAVAASTAGIHAAIACSATLVTTVTTALTNPSAPRNLTATAGGTAGDIKAVQVTITGTNYGDEVITEALPVFTVDTAGLVSGSKAFKTVTSISIPAMDGAGATVAIGFGEKIGLPYKLAHNTVLYAYLDNVREATAPTVTTSATAIESNTIDLNTALSGKVVDVYLIV